MSCAKGKAEISEAKRALAVEPQYHRRFPLSQKLQIHFNPLSQNFYSPIQLPSSPCRHPHICFRRRVSANPEDPRRVNCDRNGTRDRPQTGPHPLVSCPLSSSINLASFSGKHFVSSFVLEFPNGSLDACVTRLLEYIRVFRGGHQVSRTPVQS